MAVKLYDHQRDAIRWLWDLQLRNKGGILADDMGLGKTMSSAGAFIAGSLKSKTIKRALILAPTTLLPHWKKELIVCGLNEKKEIFSYIGTKEATRQRFEESPIASRRRIGAFVHVRYVIA